jgi:4a-hydroxytetrahydrobiopterin dehydratase
MDLTQKKCVPCEGGTPPMSESEEEKYVNETPQWKLDRDGGHSIGRRFEFDNFVGAMKFVNDVADLAEEEGHHPDICINYNKVQLDLSTHAANGLTENDFILASKIDRIVQ